MKAYTKQVGLAVIAVLSLNILVGCGGSEYTSTSGIGDANYADVASTQSFSTNGFNFKSSSYSMDDMTSYETESASEENEVTPDENIDSNANISLVKEKLVYRCDISIETLEYEETMQQIKKLITGTGGLIQSENETNNDYDWYYADNYNTEGQMWCYLQVRVPSNKYSDFIDSVGGFGNVMSKSTSIDNISQKYYDSTIRLEALQIEKDRLLEMLEKSETIEDMIAVEARLGDVESEIMSLTTNITYMDMDVAYSYVNIEVQEVLEYSELDSPVKTSTFIDRLVNTFKDTWKDFLYFLENLLFFMIRISIYLVLIGIVYVVYMRFFSEKIKQRKLRKQAKAKEKMDMKNNNYTADRNNDLINRMSEAANTKINETKVDSKDLDNAVEKIENIMDNIGK